MLSKIVSLAVVVNAASNSVCPNVPVQENFDAASYLGTWYTISRNKASPFEWFGQCETATYSLMNDGDIKVVNRGWFPWAFFNYTSAVGTANCPGGQAKCHVDFSGKESKRTGPANYEVLATDYKTYSLIYSCEIELGIYKNQDVWILARENTLPAETIQMLKDKLHSIVPDYDWDANNNVEKQANCKYTDDESESDQRPHKFEKYLDMASKFLNN